MDQTRMLMKKLLRFEALMHRYQAFRFHANGPLGNPARGQGRVLSLLKMQPQVSQKELSYLLDMRQQSLSELLFKLERAGLITRTPSEDDRRVVIITLTDKGKSASPDAETPEPDDASLLGCLTDEEQVQLSGMLDRLVRALEDKISYAHDTVHAEWDARRHRHERFHDDIHGRMHRGMGYGWPGETPGSPDDRKPGPGEA